MKKALFLTGLFLSLLTTLPAQDWMRGIGNIDGAVELKKMIPYGDNSSLVAGDFSLPTLEIGTVTVAGGDKISALVAVIDDDGEVKWAESISADGDVQTIGLGTDANANIWLAISFKSLLLEIGDTVLVNQGLMNVAFVRFTSDFSIDRIQHIITEDFTRITDFSVDDNGDIYFSRANTAAELTSFPLQFQKTSPDGVALWQQEMLTEDKRAEFNAFYFAVATGLTEAYAKLHVKEESLGYFIAYNTGNLILGDSIYKASIGGSAFIIQFDKATGNVVKVYNDTSSLFIGAIHTDQDGLLLAGVEVTFKVISYEEETYYDPEFTIVLKMLNQNFSLQKFTRLSPHNYQDFLSFQVPTHLAKDKISGNLFLAGAYHGQSLIIGKDTLPAISQTGTFLFPISIFFLRFDGEGNALGGQALGNKMRNYFSGMHFNSSNQLMLSGSFQADTLQLGTEMLINYATEVYYPGSHWMPGYHYRHPLGFVAKILPTATNLPLANVKQRFLLYPNPSQDHFYLRSEAFTEKPVQVQLFSTDGKLLSQQHILPLGNSLLVETSALPPGMYVVRVIVDGQVAAERFVKF